MADGIPANVVKNNLTGKKKVVHQARLLLWLADYSEPIRCNHVDISDIPLALRWIDTLKKGVKVTTHWWVVVCSTA